MSTTRVSLRHKTMFTYSHANTPLGQSERAYHLSYFTTITLIVSHLFPNSETFSREFPLCFSICKSKVGRKKSTLRSTDGCAAGLANWVDRIRLEQTVWTLGREKSSLFSHIHSLHDKINLTLSNGFVRANLSNRRDKVKKCPPVLTRKVQVLQNSAPHQNYLTA